MVTGIRFLKKNRIIHIFIKERTLGPNGKIEWDGDNDELWLSDYKFVKEDSGVKEGVDYHELTWSNRAIEIDTIRAPADEGSQSIDYNQFTNNNNISFLFSSFIQWLQVHDSELPAKIDDYVLKYVNRFSFTIIDSFK